MRCWVHPNVGARQTFRCLAVLKVYGYRIRDGLAELPRWRSKRLKKREPLCWRAAYRGSAGPIGSRPPGLGATGVHSAVRVMNAPGAAASFALAAWVV